MYYEAGFEHSIQGLTSVRQTATSLQGEINFNRITLFTVDNYTREIDRSHRLSTGQIQSSKVESVHPDGSPLLDTRKRKTRSPPLSFSIPADIAGFPRFYSERTALEELFGR